MRKVVSGFSHSPRGTLGTVIGFLLLSLVVPLSAQLSGERSRAIAVLSFEGSGVPQELVLGVREAVEQALWEVDGFVLTERERIDLLLEEQSLQLSGLVDEDSAVEIGRLLAADIVVTATVSRFDNIIVTIRFLDVASGEVAYIRSERLRQPSSIPGVAKRLATGAEQVFFPQRFLPRVLALTAAVRPVLPVAELGEYFDIGVSGFIGFMHYNALGNNIDLGVRLGLGYFPGVDLGAAEWLLSIPLAGIMGYSYYLAPSLYIRPQLAAGASLNLMNIDKDGFIAGAEDPEYSVHVNFYPFFAPAGVIGLQLPRFRIEAGVEYSLSLQIGKPLMDASAWLAVSVPLR